MNKNSLQKFGIRIDFSYELNEIYVSGLLMSKTCFVISSDYFLLSMYFALFSESAQTFIEIPGSQ